jgi:hypothetical protein
MLWRLVLGDGMVQVKRDSEVAPDLELLSS